MIRVNQNSYLYGGNMAYWTIRAKKNLFLKNGETLVALQRDDRLRAVVRYKKITIKVPGASNINIEIDLEAFLDYFHVPGIAPFKVKLEYNTPLEERPDHGIESAIPKEKMISIWR